MRQVILLMKIWICLFLMQQTVYVNAQENNKISIVIESTSEVATIGDTLHTLEGANATFKYNIGVNDSIIGVKSLTGFWAGKKYELKDSFDIKNGTLSIKDFVLRNLTPSSENMNFKLVVDYVVGNSVQGLVDTVKNIILESQPVHVWSSASSSVKSTSSINTFYGESITLEVATSGGYTGKSNGGWSFVWKRNGIVLPDQTTSRCNDSVPNSDRTFEIYDYEVSVINKCDNKQWYSKTYSFSVCGWQKASLAKVQEDSVDVYHGSQVILKSRKEGGFDSGWTFNWKADGTVVDNNKNEYAFQAANTDNRDKTYQVHEYTLHATNRINESIPVYECDLKYKIHVWPQCKFPSDININDETTSQIVSECVREGNTISLRVDDPLCGYWSESKSPWRYFWTKDDKAFGNDSKVVLGEKAVMGNGETKEIKTINYGLTIENLGPSNHVWDSKKYRKAVSIYRKPTTPTKLYKKGSGNSCTLIAESSVSDTRLEEYEYFLIFGYTDENGKDVSESPVRQGKGTTRYDKIPSSTFQNSGNRFWVYAMWQYEDGSQVTSGKCYLDGTINEEFDGSIYKNNTRGVIDDEYTAIEDVRYNVSVDNNAKCLNISQGCPSQVFVSFYNTNGTLIKQEKFENVTSLTYRYDLPRGLYVINVKSSSIQINKKVLIP